jgi:hypothetical protein
MKVMVQLHDPVALPLGTHWMGVCEDLRVVLDMVAKRKIPCLVRRENPSVHPVAIHSSGRFLLMVCWGKT